MYPYRIRDIPYLATRVDGWARQVRVLVITAEILTRGLMTGTQLRAEVIAGLPPDAEVVDGWVLRDAGRVVLIIHSLDFAELKRDEVIPTLDITLKTLDHPEKASTWSRPRPSQATLGSPCPICSSTDVRCQLDDDGHATDLMECLNCGIDFNPQTGDVETL